MIINIHRLFCKQQIIGSLVLKVSKQTSLPFLSLTGPAFPHWIHLILF